MDHAAQNGPRTGLIATIPKSGTWYCHYFFHHYERFLQNRLEPEGDINIRPHPVPVIGLDVLLIAHTVCPGFHHFEGDLRRKWDRLHFYHPGYNWALGFIKDRPHWYDPRMNRNARIVFLYRNPLDQAVSYFQYIQRNEQEDTRYYRDPSGRRAPIADVADFLHRAGLTSYLKLYLSYRVMSRLFSDRILMITYEQLVRSPRRTFAGILAHFGHDAEHPRNQPMFLRALEASSLESMRAVENRLGRSLAGDQTDPAERHIRDGSIGRWKKHLAREDLKRVEAGLKPFGLSLDDFQLE